MGHFRYPGSFLIWPVPKGKTIFEYLLYIRHHVLWSFDFYVVMMLAMVFPLLPVVIDWRKHPKRVFRYLAISHFVYLSSLVVETFGIIAYLKTRKAFSGTPTTRPPSAPEDDSYHPNHPLVFARKSAFATLLTVFGFITKNLWFIAPASALFLSPVLHRYGWETRWVRRLTYIPCLIGLFILALLRLILFMTWTENAVTFKGSLEGE